MRLKNELTKNLIYNMKILILESQLKTVIGERSIRYSEEEEYGIPEQIDWLNMQKEFMFIHGEAGQKVRLVNNIIHNLQKIQGR